MDDDVNTLERNPSNKLQDITNRHSLKVSLASGQVVFCRLDAEERLSGSKKLFDSWKQQVKNKGLHNQGRSGYFSGACPLKDTNGRGDTT
jgi:hypothetical protein